MTNQKLQTTDQFLNIVSDPKKAVSIIVIIVAGILLIWLVWRLFKNTVSKTSEAITTNAALASELASGGSLSYSTSEYNSMAARIYAAVKGPGTDEDTIYAQFNKLKTKADLLRLIAAFGTKDEMTLSEWLADDLNNSEINKVNNILANSGIDYSF